MGAAVDVDEAAGDATGEGRRQIGAGVAYVHDVDQFPEGRLVSGFVQQESKSFRPDAARVFNGPGEMACTRMPRGPSS